MLAVPVFLGKKKFEINRKLTDDAFIFMGFTHVLTQFQPFWI